MYYRLLAFVIGLGAAIQVNYFATAALSEFLCVLVLLAKPSLIEVKSNVVKNILFFGLLWMIGICLSDWVNDRSLTDTIKALGAVLLLLVSMLVAYSLLSRRPNRILAYGLGLGLSYALQYAFFPTSVMHDLIDRGFDPARVNDIYFAITFFPLAVWISGYFWSLGFIVAGQGVLASYAALALSYDKRSIFLVCLISVFYLAFLSRKRTRQIPMIRRQTNGKIIAFLVMSVGFIMSYQIYSYVSSHGLVGEEAMLKYEMQANTDTFGLASGRLDFFQGIYGVLERPMLGYGSYASDSTRIRERFMDRFGLKWSGGSSGLPGHSHIIGAWLFAGALSVPFWVYVIKLLVSFVWRANETDQRLLGYFFPLVLFTLWNILFSPFANRIELGFVIAFTVIQLRKSSLSRRVPQKKAKRRAYLNTQKDTG